MLGDIKIHFQHYETEEEAERKWKERIKRIHYDNLFFLFTDRDGCTYEQLYEFDRLPYKNKVVFTAKLYPQIKSSFYIKDFEGFKEVGICSKYKNYPFGKRYLDSFDYIGWLNGEYEHSESF